MSDASVPAFEGDFSVDGGGEHFRIVWTAFRVSYSDLAKGFNNLILCNRIGEKLQAISTKHGDEGDASLRKINPSGDRSISLDTVQYDMLKRMVEFEVPWTFATGPQVEKTVCWVRQWKTDD